ncbi:hypothetical protein FOCC_FOCC002327 [Frankliniella occidentalis]|nr:hypothetical protein FOCC_FOCC002327 [Frankliniella occidentalis]
MQAQPCQPRTPPPPVLNFIECCLFGFAVGAYKTQELYTSSQAFKVTFCIVKDICDSHEWRNVSTLQVPNCLAFQPIQHPCGYGESGCHIVPNFNHFVTIMMMLMDTPCGVSARAVR